MQARNLSNATVLVAGGVAAVQHDVQDDAARPDVRNLQGSDTEAQGKEGPLQKPNQTLVP